MIVSRTIFRGVARNVAAVLAEYEAQDFDPAAKGAGNLRLLGMIQ